MAWCEFIESLPHICIGLTFSSGSFINPSWFELGKSRGIETEESKIFMRSTVLVSDLLVYIPALIFFVHAWHNNRSKRTQVSTCSIALLHLFSYISIFKGLALLCLLLQPSLILIDSGHFQFNSVMLGTACSNSGQVHTTHRT